MPTSIGERRLERGATADPAKIDSLRANRYFSVISWLAAIGTATAAFLAATYPTMTDIMWLFSQAP